MTKDNKALPEAQGTRRAPLRKIQGDGVQANAEIPPREKPAEKPAEKPTDINQLLNEVLAQKQQRKHQLRAIKQFFDDPSQFGIDADDVPHSSSREEILERHKELTYRSRLLRSVLVVLRREAAKLEKQPG